MATYLIHLTDGKTRKVVAERVRYDDETSLFEASSSSGVVFLAPRDKVQSMELADPELVVEVCVTESQVRETVGQMLLENRQMATFR